MAAAALFRVQSTVFAEKASGNHQPGDRSDPRRVGTSSIMGNGSSAEQVRTEMFLRIAEKLKDADPALVRQLGGVFLFCVMRKQSVRYWTMDFNKVIVYPGEPEDEQEPDATFTLTEETLEAMATGKVAARAAVQAGKCAVTGDIMRAMKLEPYIKL